MIIIKDIFVVSVEHEAVTRKRQSWPLENVLDLFCNMEGCDGINKIFVYSLMIYF